MKNVLGVFAPIVALLVIGCSEGQSTQASLNGDGLVPEEMLSQEIIAMPVIDSMTTAIADGLLYLREEEKVARDVYTALGEKWNLKVFKNISTSEQRHMDALKVLIDRYGLTDPVGSNGQGVFANAELQKLHDDLLAQGMRSAKDALLVGKLIEEVDIKDLEEALQGIDEGSNIEFVYLNLKRGSENHLNAFNRNLERMP